MGSYSCFAAAFPQRNNFGGFLFVMDLLGKVIVLCNFQCWDILLILIKVGLGATVFAVAAG